MNETGRESQIIREAFGLSERQPATLASCYVIYERPADHPESYVVRRWFVIDGEREPRPSDEHQVAETLEEARQMLPAGLVNIGRKHSDDPAICEVWI